MHFWIFIYFIFLEILNTADGRLLICWIYFMHPSGKEPMEKNMEGEGPFKNKESDKLNLSSITFKDQIRFFTRSNSSRLPIGGGGETWLMSLSRDEPQIRCSGSLNYFQSWEKSLVPFFVLLSIWKWLFAGGGRTGCFMIWNGLAEFASPHNCSNLLGHILTIIIKQNVTLKCT